MANLHRALQINCALPLLAEVIFSFQHRPVALGKTSKLQPRGQEGLIKHCENHKTSKPKGISALVLILKINVKTL